MNTSDNPEFFRTLRGFLAGEEPDEPNYFCFSASLRIHGVGVPFEEITRTIGVEPTHQHKKGERIGRGDAVYRDDAWHLESQLPDDEPLERHILEIWQVVRNHVDYLKGLKKQFKVDLFCGYRSNCDTAGFEVSHECLEIFIALEIPFGVSVIIA